MKERMVPAQQLSDAGEDLVRLAAAKDEQIAALTAKLDAATATFDDEQAAHQDTLRLWQKAKADIAALTKESRENADSSVAWFTRTTELEREIAALTEQRDRAMKVGIEAIDFAHQWIAGLPVTPSFEDKRAAQAALEQARAQIAALDAEAAAETSPSLPETP